MKHRGRKVEPEEAPRAPLLRVGFVLMPKFTLTAFSVFVDTLRLAADEGDRSRPIRCTWSVLGESSEPVRSSCGISLAPSDFTREPKRFDYIVVVGGLLHGSQPLARDVIGFLRAAAEVGVPLVGVCTGSFVLARLGLMRGHVACVSWFHCDEYRSRFPDHEVVSNRLFLIDRKRLTCAGGTSVAHLAAFLVGRHCGRALAGKSLRIMIERAPLPGATPQPEAIVNRRARDPVVARAMLSIEQALADGSQLAALGVQLGLSMRQLQRRFLADVGLTPQAYRQRLRLQRSKWLLENTQLAIGEIGLQCGFADGPHFSRVFRQAFRTPPSRARRAKGRLRQTIAPV